MANSRPYEDLKTKIRGQVVVPGDADYDHHRSDVGRVLLVGGSDQQLAMPGGSQVTKAPVACVTVPFA